MKEGARFGIPNDPTNGGRVLLLLKEKGLIKLKPEAGLKATSLDVIDNPKKIKFVELDAAQRPRALDDLDASAVNTNFALSAGLNPAKDAIALKAAKSPYVNLLAGASRTRTSPGSPSWSRPTSPKKFASSSRPSSRASCWPVSDWLRGRREARPATRQVGPSGRDHVMG